MSFAFRFHFGCFTCISSQSVNKLKSNNINIYYIIVYSKTFDWYFHPHKYHILFICLGRHVTRNRVDVLSRLSRVFFFTIFDKYRFFCGYLLEWHRNVFGMFISYVWCVSLFLFVDFFLLIYLLTWWTLFTTQGYLTDF